VDRGDYTSVGSGKRLKELADVLCGFGVLWMGGREGYDENWWSVPD